MNIDTFFKRAMITLIPSTVAARAIMSKLDMSELASVGIYILLLVLCGVSSLFIVGDGPADSVVEKWRSALANNPTLALLSVVCFSAYATLIAVALLDLSLVIPVGTVGAVIAIVMIAIYAIVAFRDQSSQNVHPYADFFAQPQRRGIKVALGIEWTLGSSQMTRRMTWAAA